MRIEIQIRDDSVRVGLSEHLMVEDHDTLRTLLAAIADAVDAYCVLDLRALESIGPGGLALVRAAQAAAERDGRGFTVQRPLCPVHQLSSPGNDSVGRPLGLIEGGLGPAPEV